jgi:hypothetical protein
MSNKKWRKGVGEAVKPAVDPSIPVQDVKQAEAPAEPRPAARSALSDQEVLDILDLGAKFIHNFLSHATDTLSQLGYEQVRRVAMEVEAPEPAYVTPQKRPRGRMHSLLLLIKYGITATALVQRIFKVTHPHLFPAGGERRERVTSGVEKFMAMVKKAMPDGVPGTA